MEWWIDRRGMDKKWIDRERWMNWWMKRVVSRWRGLDGVVDGGE